MAAARAGLRPLLGPWAVKVPSRAKPSTVTSARRSETQHVQPRPRDATQGGHHQQGPQTLQRPQPPPARILPWCGHSRSDPHHCLQERPGTLPPEPSPVSLTTCELTLGRYRDCRYRESTWRLLTSGPLSLRSGRTLGSSSWSLGTRTKSSRFPALRPLGCDSNSKASKLGSIPEATGCEKTLLVKPCRKAMVHKRAGTETAVQREHLAAPHIGACEPPQRKDDLVAAATSWFQAPG
ncbi:hypothetical protein MC885_009077 [Smutsia gigantea]|nr:hypothetical protein MC885_009077 [Smutsia gigantea]